MNEHTSKKIEHTIMCVLRKTNTKMMFDQLCRKYWNKTAEQYVHSNLHSLPMCEPENLGYILSRVMEFADSYRNYNNVYTEDLVIMQDIKQMVENYTLPLYNKVVVDELHGALKELNVLDEYLLSFYDMRHSTEDKLTRDELLFYNKKSLTDCLRGSTYRGEMPLIRSFNNTDISFYWPDSRKGAQFWWKVWMAMQMLYIPGAPCPIRNMSVDEANEFVATFKRGLEPNGFFTYANGEIVFNHLPFL